MYSTDYFIRYAACESFLRCDLERGYSFADYAFFDSVEEALESDYVEFYGKTADDIMPTSDGRFGFALDGLCGFGPFESAEEAKIAIDDRGGYGIYSVAGIFIGSYVSDDAESNGCQFRPKRLVEVVND